MSQSKRITKRMAGVGINAGAGIVATPTQPAPHPLDASLKGVKYGNCNITSCQRPGAICFNIPMQKWYCLSCAMRLNEANPQYKAEHGVDMVTIPGPEERRAMLEAVRELRRNLRREMDFQNARVN